MRFSVNTFMWTPSFSEADIPLLEQIKAWGADEVEIARSNIDAFPTVPIRRELKRLGLSCTLSASPPTAELSPIHPDPDCRRAAIEHLRKAMNVAAELGARLLVGPLYANVGWFTGARPTKDQFRWAVEAFQVIGDQLDAVGLELALEAMNRFESFFLPTAVEGVRLCEAIGHSRIGLLLDTAHMVIEEKSLPQAVRTAGRWLKHMQTPDSDRGTPGKGAIIDWLGLFRALDEVGYDGACAIESFPTRNEQAAAKVWAWRDFAASPEALARDGVAFLRRAQAEAVA